jgi:hypothetical protein
MTHQNVYEAVNAVMQEVGYVVKQSSPNLNYTYAGEAALIAAIRPSMVENGLVVHPSGVLNRMTEQYTNKNGTVMTRVIADFTFTFYHGPSQTGFNVTVVGEGVDSGDKAANKAMTAAYKYALRETFCIETGDDPDKYPSTDFERGMDDGQEYSKPKPSKPATRPQPPQDASKALPASGSKPSATGRPYAPKSLVKWFGLQLQAATEAERNTAIDTEAAKALAMAFKNTGLHDEDRRAFGKAMMGVDSFKDLSVAAANAMASWLKDVKSARQEAQDYLASLDGVREAGDPLN